MGGAVMNSAAVDFSDVQGLARYGYGGMKRARYELLRIRDAAAAKRWLRSVPIADAVEKTTRPQTAVNVAFTAPGLRALGLDEAAIAGFSHEFRGGMAEPSRARQLGDVEANDPAAWWWGRAGDEPHLVVMLFGTLDRYDGFVREIQDAAWHEAFEAVPGSPLLTCDLDGIEPFGFTDGISQPEIDWQMERGTPRAQFEYSNRIALGELLLGYPNEYGKLTDRPLLEPSAATAGLPDAGDFPEKKDLGRNGTYLVIRQLEQDVRAFWQTLYQQAGGVKDEAEALAASMVGRQRLGEPLVPASPHKIEGIPDHDAHNHFTFDSDPRGSRCPFGSHLRRANPRNADFPHRPKHWFEKLVTLLGFGPRGFRDDLMSSVRFHRIVRRGREYGSGLKPEDALQPGPAGEEARGIHFLCLNANISRQFEFLQNAWLASTKFSGLSGESDPLTGTRHPIPGCPVTHGFTLPAESGVPRRLHGLPQFVTLRGGAYFFMPGLRALRHLAELPDPPAR